LIDVEPTAAAGMPSVDLARPSDRDDWDGFVAVQPAGDPLQAWGWGEVTAVGGERPVRLIARGRGGRVHGLVQLLVRQTSFGRRVIYAPHGPLVDSATLEGDAVLGALLTGIWAVGAAERAIVVKVDPRATNGRAAQAWRSALESHGLIRARADLQARTTRVLDLRQGSEPVFASLEKDTRNLVRRASREGVTTRVLAEPDRPALVTFRTILLETVSRMGVRVRSAEAFERLAAEFGPSGSMRLVLADLSGMPIAGCLALLSGTRAFYLYAAARRDPVLRHANGAYASLWALCEELAGAGVETLDLWGVVEPDDKTADPSWAGFSLFKRGFGGEFLEHPGTFDLVLSKPWYRLRDLRERIRR
jgi:lipid II:glycine glycyltransferase (peptidoglycan interpeptide bridge formation enzyme)